jgi:hypothetical protein
MWWNGRHDSFRSYWAKVRGGSSPLIRTITYIIILICVLFISTPARAATISAVVSNGNTVTATFTLVTGADNYIIQRQGTPASGYKQFDNITASPFVDSGAPVGKWKYGLTAKNGTGVVEGNIWSNEVTVASSTTTTTTGPNDTLVTANGKAVKDNDLRAWLNAFINWIAYRIGPGVVLLMIIYAGVEYIGSQGDPAKIKAAKERIEGSLLGLVVLLLIGVIMRMLLPSIT